MDFTPERLPLPPAPSRLPRPRAGLLIAVLVLSFVLGLAWLVAGQWQSESSRAALEELRARSVRLHHLDTLLLQMLDAESSVRGYLLTQNPVYLTPYQDGQADLERTLAALRADAWTDEGQRETVDHLALLVDMRWSLLSQAIELGVPPGADPPYSHLPGPGTAAGEVKWNFGKFLVDPAGEVVAQLGSEVEPMSKALTRRLEAILPGK